MGFKVVAAPSTLKVEGTVAANGPTRGREFTELFANPDVDAVLCTLGGGRAADMLPYIDWAVLRAYPKPLIGYSDITVLHLAFGKMTGCESFYGPTLMTEFAEFPNMPALSAASFLDVVQKKISILELRNVSELAQERIDWSSRDDHIRSRSFGQATGPFIGREGTCTGAVIGGCIESLHRMKGTRFWPEIDGSILLLETSHDTLNLGQLHDSFVDFMNMGVWAKVGGVVFGQKPWLSSDMEAVVGLLSEFTSNNPVPVVGAFPFGHITPIATIPFGRLGTLTTDPCRLTVQVGEDSRSAYG